MILLINGVGETIGKEIDDMRKKVLLGVDKNKEIVFGEYEVTYRNGFPEFAASFDTVRPFNGDDVNLEDYFAEYANEDYMGADFVLQQCRRLDCSPQNLASELADECYDVRDALDCSLFPEEYVIGNGYGMEEYWYFESGGCGQHDIRDTGMEKYVDKKACDKFLSLWDQYHLKRVNELYIKEELREIEERLNVDWEEWISGYIKEELM